MATTDGRCQLIKSKHNIECIEDRRSHEYCLGLDLMDRIDCSEVLGRADDKTDTVLIINKQREFKLGLVKVPKLI